MQYIYTFPDGWPRGVIVKALVCEIVVNEFERHRGIMFTFGQIPYNPPGYR